MVAKTRSTNSRGMSSTHDDSAALNQAFGTSALKTGLPLGVATVRGTLV